MKRFQLAIVAVICIVLMGCGGGGGADDSSSGDPGGDGSTARAIGASDLTSSPPPQTAGEMGASIREQLLYSRAYEIFGESVMNEFLGEVDRMLAMGYGEAVMSAASQSIRRATADGNCETMGGSFEKDGIKYEGSMTMCPREDDDKFGIKFQFVTGLSDVVSTSTQKGLRMECGVDTQVYKCPTAEGVLTGSSLIHFLLYVSDGETATNSVSDTQLDMTAQVNDDAEVEKVTLALNIGVAVNETGFPPVGYNGVSTAEGTDLDLTVDGYVEQLIHTMNPPDKFYNAETVGKCIGVGVGMALGSLSAISRDSEKNWQADGKCVQLRITPEDLTMSSGEKAQVEADVILMKDQSPLEAKVQAATECGESITPSAARYVPDVRAKFEYTAPDGDKAGCFTINATSKAGKDSREVNINCTKSLHLDSTITFTTSDALMKGHIQSVIPLVDKDGVTSGSGPITYVSFEQVISSSECTFETGSLSVTDATVSKFSANYDTAASTEMVLLPFHAYESYTAYCPDSPPAPSGTHELFFSGYFFYLHYDELSPNGWTITEWTQGADSGVPLVKRYERTENVEGGTITEETVIELHTGPPQ